MKLQIIKTQEIINDKPQEVKYTINLDREFEMSGITPMSIIYANLFLEEITALRDKLNELTLPTNTPKE